MAFHATARQSLFACDAFHQIHNQLVVVVGKIGVLEDGGQFKLVGGNFVVARLDGMPSLWHSISNSFIKAVTRGGIEPK